MILKSTSVTNLMSVKYKKKIKTTIILIFILLIFDSFFTILP